VDFVGHLIYRSAETGYSSSLARALRAQKLLLPDYLNSVLSFSHSLLSMRMPVSIELITGTIIKDFYICMDPTVQYVVNGLKEKGLTLALTGFPIAAGLRKC
jgi:hypothetical protein